MLLINFDFAPNGHALFNNTDENEKAIIFTLGTESVDLEELSSSLFVYLMLIVYIMCPSLCCLHTCITSPYSPGQPRRCNCMWYDGSWSFSVLKHYCGAAMLAVCPSHVFKGRPRSICSVNFFKKKKIEASIGTSRSY